VTLSEKEKKRNSTENDGKIMTDMNGQRRENMASGFNIA
jgi:hypothetical protein